MLDFRLGRHWLQQIVSVAIFFGISTAGYTELRGHGGPVQAIDIAKDGIHGLSGGFDYAVVHWDFAKSHALARLLGHDGGVNSVAFVPNPDGNERQAITGGDDGKVIVWDLSNNTILYILAGHKQRIVSVDVSPAGRFAASAAWDQSIRIWNIENGTLLHTLDAGANRANAVVFTEHGQRVATANDKGEIREWDVISGKRTRLLKAHAFPINALAISGDGSVLASASVDKTIRLWRWPDAREIALIELHDTAVLGLAMSKDGSLLASAGADGVIQLWSIPDGKPVGSLKGHVGAVWAVSFAPDSKRLYSAGRDEQIRIWDLVTLAEINPAGARNIPQPELLANMTEPEKRGQWQFRKCRICHSISEDSEFRAGPSLFKIVNRPAGTLTGYEYSVALRDADFIWTEQKIMDLFLLGPQSVIPGSKMPLQRLRSERDVQDLMEYIRRASGGISN